VRAVVQTRTGYPWGNCVRASWASLLGVPIEEVPDFSPGVLGEDANQLEAERDWLRGMGYDLVVVSARGDRPNVPPGVCHLMSGLSPRGFGHRVVGRGGKMVWDPHPSQAGLTELWSYAFVVPLVESQLEAKRPELLGFCGW
jgi:hypothetical protein